MASTVWPRFSAAEDPGPPEEIVRTTLPTNIPTQEETESSNATTWIGVVGLGHHYSDGDLVGVLTLTIGLDVKPQLDRSVLQSQDSNLTNELEQGYEAALLIQSLELEFYGDRKVRPELELSVPRTVQATILRRFRAALQILRNSIVLLEPNRAQLDPRNCANFN